MKVIEIINSLYNALLSNLSDGIIPIQLRPASTVGTVQDDPFDSWVGDKIRQIMPNIEVFHVDPA